MATRLQEYRERAEWTQQEVVDALHHLAWRRDRRRIPVDVSMLSKWERGVKRPSPYYRELLCTLYGATPEKLGFRRPLPVHAAGLVSLARDEDEDDEAALELAAGGGPTIAAVLGPRGDVVSEPAALLTPAAIVGRDAHPDAGLDDAHRFGVVDVSRSGSLAIGTADVQLLVDARNHYELMYRRVGGLATRPMLLGFLEIQTAPLLAASYSERTERQLHRAAAGLVALAGICAYDAEHHGLAQRDFQQALRMAKSSCDRGVGGYVLGLMVNQALALGNFRGAVGFARVALRSAGHDMSPALVADVRGMQAKAYAQLGDARATHAAIASAEAAGSKILPGQGPAEASYVQPGLIEVHLTEALLSLGDIGSAQRYAHQMMQSDVHPRGQVNRLATTAALALRSGDADRAAALAIEMVDRAQGIESRRLYDRFRKLRTALADSDANTTTEAVERIDRTLYATP